MQIEEWRSLLHFIPECTRFREKGQEDLSCTLGKKIGDINKGQCLDRIRDNQITTRELVRLRKGQ